MTIASLTSPNQQINPVCKRFIQPLTIATTLLVATVSIGNLAHAESNASLMKKGMYKDPNTGLIWMRCSIGQKWNGSTCTGNAIKMNLQDANDYFALFNEQVSFGGKRDWRLPTIAELSSLRQCSKGWYMQGSKTIGDLTTSSGKILLETIPDGTGDYIKTPEMCAFGSRQPTINSQIFPRSKDDHYWSSSPYYDWGGVWGVDFTTGSDCYAGNNTNSGYVRAVRSGR